MSSRLRPPVTPDRSSRYRAVGSCQEWIVCNGQFPSTQRTFHSTPVSRNCPVGCEIWLELKRPQAMTGAALSTAFGHSTSRSGNGFPNSARRSFLRHGRAWWNVHRHRMPPEAAARIDAATASGRLAVMAARLCAVEPREKSCTIRYQRRGASTIEVLEVDAIVECRGVVTNPAQTSNPAVTQPPRQWASTRRSFGYWIGCGAEWRHRWTRRDTLGAAVRNRPHRPRGVLGNYRGSGNPSAMRGIGGPHSSGPACAAPAD